MGHICIAVAAAVLMLTPAALAAAKPPPQYAGEMKLSGSEVRPVLGELCVAPHGRWLPGAGGSKGEFITDAQLAANYKRLAKKANGSVRKHDLVLVAKYQREAKADLPVCMYLAEPLGAVNVASAARAVKNGVSCGDVGGTWTPITPVSGGEYIADSRYAADYHVVVLRTTGTTKATATGGYKTWLARASQYAAACSAAGSQPGPTQPRPTLPPINAAHYATPEPEKIPAPARTATSLQFNFSGAQSVTLSSGTTTTAAVRANVRAHATAGSSGSGLDVVSASGQTSDAVVNGTSTISHFYIAPNDEVFVAFSGPVNLADPSTAPAQGQGCVLAEIDPTVGNPACVDSTLSSIDWPSSPSNGIQSPAIQFDSTGAIYYLGVARGGTTELRKYYNGVITNLISDQVQVGQWVVLPSGYVFVSGTTSSTGATWTRVISPADSLSGISTTTANFLAAFPDGNVYVGFWGAPFMGVFDYLTASNELDPTQWIGSSLSGLTTSRYNDTSSICTDAQPYNFCGWSGSYIAWDYRAANGEEFVLAGPGGSSGDLAMEYYPQVRVLPTAVQNVTVAEGIGDDLLLTGTDPGGNNILTLFNTDTNTEQELIGPNSPTGQIEIYHLSYDASDDSAWFDGLQFSDNQYVIGNVNLSTDQVTIANGDTQNWADFQAFGG